MTDDENAAKCEQRQQTAGADAGLDGWAGGHVCIRELGFVGGDG